MTQHGMVVTATAEGVLLVDKPAGITSHDIVSIARRATGVKRVGHAGTLDPFATGLLVLLVGRATRLLPYVDGEPKVYEATISFGAEMDTDDSTGAVVREAPPPSPDAIDRAIERLTGEIQQVAPSYSAKKIAGRRAYRVARAGETPLLAPSTVSVHAWENRAFDGTTFHARITCGGGTYIRALARDLGRLTASAAHLSALRRTRSGHFDVARAASMDDVKRGSFHVLPPVDAVPSLQRATLTSDELAIVLHGGSVHRTFVAGRVALIDEAGALVAIGESLDGVVQPRAVFRDV